MTHREANNTAPSATLLLDKISLSHEYDRFAKIRLAVVRDLEALLDDLLEHLNPKPTVKGRLKSFPSYFNKLIRLAQKQGAGVALPVITDTIGVRVICPFIEDLGRVEQTITNAFEVREIERKGSDFSFKEFGYESTHILITIPPEIVAARGVCGATLAEIQLRTILQDAWAEVEHELVYKVDFNPLGEPLKRKLAAVNASLSLADVIFQEIRDYQKPLNRELNKRRNSFYNKIEETADRLLEETSPDFLAEPFTGSAEIKSSGGLAVDDLLLDALYAHNAGQFDRAAALYSQILQLDLAPEGKAAIYKHRGMARFAQSQYDQAIADFTESLTYDAHSYLTYYYRALVKSVLQDYEPAIADFNASLQLNPIQHFALYRRAQAYYHVGRYEAALADCNQALAISPEAVKTRQLQQLLVKKINT